MQLPYSEQLEIKYLSRLFDNMSESYKIFWFQAIVEGVLRGKNEFSFNELIDSMIADAWYMVSEYHLNLGPSDTLEKTVLEVYKLSGLRSSEKKEKILEFLEACRDPGLLNRKRTLTDQVPYRLQAPFMPGFKGTANWRKKGIAERINQQKRLMYYFVEICGLDSKILIQLEWTDYVKENQEIIKGWIQYHLILYLQKRNPSVPGIASKLFPPEKRNLTRVKHYWKALAETEEFRDVYSGQPLPGGQMSIDHFVPWSYVAHDELWNLIPTTRWINASKNNRLPDWNTYFGRLCRCEYQAYELVWRNDKIHSLFERCMKEHVNDKEAVLTLCRPGIGQEKYFASLENILRPVYQAAQNVGFGSWTYQEKEFLK